MVKVLFVCLGNICRSPLAEALFNHKIKQAEGFGMRVEGEWMNSIVPPQAISKGDGTRQWVFSSMTGLKKEYKFFGKVKGFTIVQFDLVRLIKPSHNSPYADVVNTRFGFEFPIRKKVRKPAANDNSPIK